MCGFIQYRERLLFTMKTYTMALIWVCTHIAETWAEHGALILHNKCPFMIYVEGVSNVTYLKTELHPKATLYLPFRESFNGIGNSLKVSINSDSNDITQVEYSACVQSRFCSPKNQVYYDLSTIVLEIGLTDKHSITLSWPHRQGLSVDHLCRGRIKLRVAVKCAICDTITCHVRLHYAYYIKRKPMETLQIMWKRIIIISPSIELLDPPGEKTFSLSTSFRVVCDIHHFRGCLFGSENLNNWY